MRSRRWQSLALVLAVASLACGEGLEHPGVAGAPQSLDQAVTCAAGTITQGVDVSSYQGTINWTQAKAAGIDFAYAKATEGDGSGCGWADQDGQFPANWKGMNSAGVVRGAYHFFHPSCNGTTQADYFLAYAGALGAGDLPPMLDWEVTDGVSGNAAGTQALAFIAEIKAKTGMPTVVYTSPGLWSGFGVPQAFGSNPLFVADWTYATSSCPTLPGGWSNWVFWQWSDGQNGTGTVSGIPATVDRDVYNGSLTQLQQLANTTVTLPIAQQSGNDAITVVNWPDEHMDVFAMTPAGEMEHANTTTTGDSWTAFASLASGADCGSAASFWGAPWTYPELFSPLSAGSTAHLWYTSGVGWNKYQSYGGSDLSHFATLVWLDGRTEVFALGAAGDIWHNFWDTTTVAWSGWASLGGSFVTGVGTIMWSDGTGELYATDSAGDIWHSWSGTGTGFTNGWYTWTKFGSGMASRPSPVRWADGHAEVFVRGADNQLYHADFSMTSGWPAFTVLSAGSQIIGEPSAIMNSGKGSTAGPEVFARDTTGQVVHLWWNGSAYTSFTALGTEIAASDPFGWTRGDGNAELFAVDQSGDFVHSYRPSTGTWGAWSSIGTGFDSCAPALPVVTTDAGVTTTDAGEGERDAGIEKDAGTEPDAGVEKDAGATADAGAVEADAGAPQMPPVADGGDDTNPLKSQGGCSCGSAGGSADAALLALLVFALVSLRRRLV
jgi:lysozyme